MYPNFLNNKFQAGDAPQKWNKGVFGAKGGDKEVRTISYEFACYKLLSLL